MGGISNDTRDEFSNIEIDHVKPISSFDVSTDDIIEKSFQLDKYATFIKKVHLYQGITFDFLDYRLQFMKIYQFLKLNDQEG